MSRHAATSPRPVPMTVFVDTSAYFALTVPDDQNHTAARATRRRLQNGRARLYTTRYILAETHALLVARRRNAVDALRALRTIEASRTLVISATEADEEAARAILERYDDHLFSLTDAVSFAIMERLRIEAVFTFDADFAEYGLTVLRPEP